MCYVKPMLRQKQAKETSVTLRFDSAVPGLKQRPFTDPCGRMLTEQANANPHANGGKKKTSAN